MGPMCFPEKSVRNHEPTQRNISVKREPILKILCQFMSYSSDASVCDNLSSLHLRTLCCFHTVPSRGNISIITQVLQICIPPYQILSLFNCFLSLSLNLATTLYWLVLPSSSLNYTCTIRIPFPLHQDVIYRIISVPVTSPSRFMTVLMWVDSDPARFFMR